MYLTFQWPWPLTLKVKELIICSQWCQLQIIYACGRTKTCFFSVIANAISLNNWTWPTLLFSYKGSTVSSGIQSFHNHPRTVSWVVIAAAKTCMSSFEYHATINTNGDPTHFVLTLLNLENKVDWIKWFFLVKNRSLKWSLITDVNWSETSISPSCNGPTFGESRYYWINDVRCRIDLPKYIIICWGSSVVMNLCVSVCLLPG